MKTALGLQIDLVVWLSQREEVLVRKISGRRQCEKCGQTYNVADIATEDGYRLKPVLPEVRGQCDECGRKLVRREDDSEGVVRERLRVYREKTVPIVEWYRKEEGTEVVEMEAKRGIEDYPELREMVREKLRKKEKE